MNYRDFGESVLGPIISIYLSRLHGSILNGSDDKQAILFCARAGVRIYDLYEQWANKRGLEVPTDSKIISISRLVAIKALYSKNSEMAINMLGRENSNNSLIKTLSSIGFLNMDISNRLQKEITAQIPLHEFMSSDMSLARDVREDLLRQSKAILDYLNNQIGGAERVLMIDSGWKGTSQFALKNAFTNIEWIGIYFGCIGRYQYSIGNNIDARGLIFDSEYYRNDKKETLFVVHRHLIESLFEPNIPSCIMPPVNNENTKFNGLAESLGGDWDNVYIGVKKYISTVSIEYCDEIKNYHQAIQKLHEMVCYPVRGDITIVAGKARSHDLGRDGQVEPLISPKDRFHGDSKALRVEQAIWQTGQIAAEYDVEIVRELQKRILSANYKNPSTFQNKAFCSNNKTVAIITRTKDRPLLLKRAAESVSSQRFVNYTWVIVNDGGDPEPVRKILRNCKIDPSKIIFLSNITSMGMESASNLGIKNSKSDYIVIHDDDDSWHPDFLIETVGFLSQSENEYKGVICGTDYISEEIVDNQVLIHKKIPYNDWVETVQISEMLVGNFFAPISFLYSREVFDDIHGYDEKLPVLGDWDFNIRFLMKADIGVIKNTLANYHHRDVGMTDAKYSNSVIGGIDKHKKYNSIVRNNLFRSSFSSTGLGGLSSAIVSAYFQQDIRGRIDKRI